MATFDFPKQKGLQTYSAIYVPSTKDVDKKISKGAFDKRVKETQKFLSDKFGGSTTDRRVGTYTSRKGKLVREDIAIVENYSDYEDWKKKDKVVRNYLKKKRKAWKQESLSFEFEAPNKARKLVFVS
jgi:hypothetical protein